MARRRRFSEEAFGPTIEALMSEVGVTYRELAGRTGLSAGYLNHLVHGNRPVPSNDVVSTLADALGVEPQHFREYRIRVSPSGSRGCPTSSTGSTSASASSGAREPTSTLSQRRGVAQPG